MNGVGEINTVAMKKIYLITLALLALSCNREELNDYNNAVLFHNASIIAVMENDDETRSLVDSDGKFTWEKGDKISVWSTSGTFTEFVLSDGAEGNDEARFSGNISDGAEMAGYAVYPSSLSHKYSDGNLTLHLPSEYGDFLTEYSPNTNAITIADAGDTEAGDNGTRIFKFRHLAGVLRLSLENVPAGAAQVVFTANVGITGDFTVNPAGTDPVIGTTETNASNNSVTIKFKPLESTGWDTMQFFCPLPVGEYDGFTFDLLDKDGNQLWSRSVSQKNNILRRTLSILPTVSCMTQSEIERAALIELYEATGGDNWTNNTNWCSDKDVSEWYGISNAYDGMTVSTISLDLNNLTGEIPESIGKFKNLQVLYLSDNKITGLPESIGNLKRLSSFYADKNELTSLPESIGNLSELHYSTFSNNKLTSLPESIGNLKNLEWLNFQRNQITSIPESIGNLSNLTSLDLSLNQLSGSIPSSIGNLSKLETLALYINNLTGSIPESLGNLKNAKEILLYSNPLSGTVPQSVIELDAWAANWMAITGSTNIDISTFTPPTPTFTDLETISGTKLSDTIYGENELTILYLWESWCPYSCAYAPTIQTLHETYGEKGLYVLGCTSTSLKENVEAFVSENGITWETFIQPAGNPKNGGFDLYVSSSPSILAIDKTGKVVFESISNSYYAIEDFVFNKFNSDEDLYKSTDYTKDGTVTQLKTATVTNGIDIVIMGDAYSDRMIADGTYRTVMEKAAEYLFAEEPYATYKDWFNIYMVNVVSENEIVGKNTALETSFGAGTHVQGNDTKCINYAKAAISESKLDEAMIVVMMNSTRYAGTCYMYSAANTGDYGSGTSISYFPIGTSDEAFKQVLNHEANGHGFAKLDDEYVSQGNGAVPSAYLEERYKPMETLGWWKNTDYTSNANEVKWAHFLADPNYANEGLGIYEGASTYLTGMWRPTENSIMNENTGGFNAPSREAIYYRIHKLVNGADWVYEYDDFVTYDAKNRTSTKSGRPNYVEARTDFIPLAPPVVVGKTWREALTENE